MTCLLYCVQIIKSSRTIATGSSVLLYLMGYAQHPSDPQILKNICQLGWSTADCAGGMQLWIRPSCQAEIPEHYTTDIST